MKKLDRPGRKVILNCEQCNEDFEALQIKLRERGVIKFCSTKCYHTNRKQNALTPEEKKEKNILYQAKFKYNLTETEYKNLMNSNDGTCDICENKFKSKNDKHIDHCHNSGKIRGILCNTCNQGLGYFKDSLPLLNNAINYLNR